MLYEVSRNLVGQLHVNFNPHPKICKKCNSHAKVENDLLKAIRAQEKKPELEHDQKKIDEMCLDVHASRVHQVQVEKQRKFINNIRDTLGPTDCSVVLDFVSMYSLTSKKFNFLVFLIFRRVNGVLSHTFHDLFAEPGDKT